MAREVVDRATVAERRPRITYEEKAWDGVFEGKSEWVDGEVIIFLSTTIRHAAMSVFLTPLVSQYVQLFGLGRVFAETVEMRLAGAARVPDILFVATANLGRLEATRLRGPADLVIELVCNDSVERDRSDKLADYAAAPVPEYWLVDSRVGQQGAAFCRLVDGAYVEMPLDAEGRYWSAALPGFWLRPEWLWQEPPPNTLSILAEIAPDAVRAALAGLDAPRSAGLDAGETGTDGPTR